MTDSGNKESGATVISHYGNEILICDELDQRHRAIAKQNLPPLVCGDRVIWEKNEFDEAIITSLQERHGTLTRSTPFKASKLIAANIDLAMVIVSHKPMLNTGLLDRYLAACELAGIDVHIVFNKMDTLTDELATQIKEQLAVYQHIGYPVYYISAKRQSGTDDLKTGLQNKTGVLVGQSGVGKSSIIRALLPSAKPRVAKVSDKTSKGRHTTTTSELYTLDKHSHLIDSPGIREFGLGEVDPDRLAEGFREFKEYLGNCKFRDCSHINEPGCAIISAVEAKTISQQRWDSYRNIYASLEE
jgi:ribosome biogenesis GTPase